MCVCVTYRHPPASACGHEGDWCAMFLVVVLEGQQELAIDRCQRVDLYCVLYIDHCKYSQYSVCMSMYEYVFTAIIVLCIIILISIMGKSCRVPNVTLVH